MIALHAGNPTRWGAEKQYLVRSWIPGYVPKSDKSPKAHPEIGAAASTMVPVVFPGAEWTAFLGFAANGESLNANTTESVAAQRFHEIGVMGTTAGPRDQHAPCMDPRAKFAGDVQPNSWVHLYDHEDVVSLLGRKAVVGHNEWKGKALDQMAVGVVDLARSSQLVANALDDRIRPKSEGSLWRVAIGFMGWSAGDPRAAAHIRKHAEPLAAVSESERWATLIRLVAAGPSLPKGHSNPAYSVARTWQKLDCGRQLQEFMGPTCSAWFDAGLGADEAALKETIARHGYGA
jgi:hypothetical protein